MGFSWHIFYEMCCNIEIVYIFATNLKRYGYETIQIFTGILRIRVADDKAFEMFSGDVDWFEK